MTVAVDNSTGSQSLNPSGDFLDDASGNQTFILKSSDQVDLQAYVEAGIKLPTSDSEMRMMLGYTDDESSRIFSNLVNVYSDIYTHCSEFKTLVYPKSVSTAYDVYNYASKVPEYLDGLIEVIDGLQAGLILKTEAKDAVDDLVGSLKQDIDRYVNRIDEVHNAIQQFDTDTVADKGNLDTVTSVYSTQYNLNDQVILDEQTEIESLKSEIASLKEEYKQDVIIASTTVTYTWVPFIGWLIGPTIAGVYGDKAVQANEKISAKQTDLDNKEADLKRRIVLKGSLTLANESLTGISDKAKKALDALALMKTSWTNQKSALDQASSDIDSLLDDKTKIGIKTDIDTAKTSWAKIAKLAENYTTTAYLKVEEGKTV